MHHALRAVQEQPPQEKTALLRQNRQIALAQEHYEEQKLNQEAFAWRSQSTNYDRRF
jgi:hypothetical protein